MDKHDALALDVTRLQAVHAPPPINGAKMMRVAVAAGARTATREFVG